MKFSKLGKKKLKPLKDLVAFIWIRPKTKSGFLIPDIYYSGGLRPGRFYLARVLAVGPKVKELKKNDIIMVHEYASETLNQEFREDEIYFIKEKFIRCKVWGIKEGTLNLRIISKQEEKELERKGEIFQENKK